MYCENTISDIKNPKTFVPVAGYTSLGLYCETVIHLLIRTLNDDICKTIMALNVNKTLGKNKISVKIIKISDEVMTKPSLLSVEIAKLWQMYKLNNDS